MTMRRWRGVVVAAAVVAVVGACLYLFAREGGAGEPAAGAAANGVEGNPDPGPVPRAADAGQPVPPMPPRSARLRDAFKDLQSRADAGDAAAATRLYRDLGVCARLAMVATGIEGVRREVLGDRVETSDLAQLEDYRLQLDAVEKNKQNMRKLADYCESVDQGMLDALVPNLRKAARLGEEHARSCYLARGPAFDGRALVRHPEWIEAYRSSVSSLVDEGLRAGDWRVVDILRDAYRPGADGMLSGVLGTDPVLHYRYLRLYRLGAQPHRVAELDRQLEDAAARITAEQRSTAELWARSTFIQAFRNGESTESTVPGWDPCAFPFDPL